MIPSIWQRVPVLLRATLVAVAILTIGQIPPGVFLFLGLTATPGVPWFLPATMGWLLLFWLYLSGRGWPAATTALRQSYLRAPKLPTRVWLWSLLAGGPAMMSVLCGALLTGRIASLPKEAYDAPFDLGSFPAWTIVAFFMNVALVAGVVEEAAFRGYMLSMVERRHGWAVAIFSVAVVFYVVHLSHAYATPAFIPFFAAYSAVHGMLVFFTRSIRPSVLLHVLGDATILPIQYGVIANPLGSSIRAHVLAIVCFAIPSLLAFWRLARVRGE